MNERKLSVSQHLKIMAFETVSGENKTNSDTNSHVENVEYNVFQRVFVVIMFVIHGRIVDHSSTIVLIVFFVMKSRT